MAPEFFFEYGVEVVVVLLILNAVVYLYSNSLAIFFASNAAVIHGIPSSGEAFSSMLMQFITNLF